MILPIWLFLGKKLFAMLLWHTHPDLTRTLHRGFNDSFKLYNLAVNLFSVSTDRLNWLDLLWSR